MTGVICCTNFHSFWSYFCSQAYVDCGCLRKSPVKGLNGLFPSRNFPGQPALLCLALPDETPKISVHHHYLDTCPKEVLLRQGYIPWGNDQSTFCRIWEVASWWASRLQVPKMRQDVRELSSRPRIICVPQLCYAGGCTLKLPYEGGDPYAIGYHGEGVPLGHSLLALQELT